MFKELVAKIYDLLAEMADSHLLANQLTKKKYLKGLWIALGAQKESSDLERCLEVLEKLATLEFELKPDVEFHLNKAVKK